MIRSFTDLEVYKRAQRLYPEIVRFTAQFPREGWHLRDQLCRAANSVTANIAEGFGRSTPEFKLFLTRSLGSCNENMSHLQNAMNAKFGDLEKGKWLYGEYDIIGKQLYQLKNKWK
ncbi:four helix bundle protein [Candidatus Wolfebacteria bacterium]|nr:four helix bundle protein [Candidatus Wolfebacteria bacterium]